MREERGKLAGDQIISEYYTLWGMIAGDVMVADGGKLYLRGSIFGDLHIAPGGRVHIFGVVNGKVTVESGAKLIHSGTVGGDLVNNGGRIHVDLGPKINGKVKTREGETVFQQPMRLQDGKS